MQDINCERDTIAKILYFPSKIDDWLLLLDSSYFSDERRIYFDCIKKLRNEGKEIDQVVLYDELKKHDIKFDSTITSIVPSSNMRNNIEVLKKQNKLRQLKQLSMIISDSVDNNQDTTITINNAVDVLYKLTNDTNKEVWKQIGDIAINRAKELHEPLEKSKIIKTYLKELDNTIVGLFPGDYVIIGARPSTGKTAFMLKIAGNIAHPAFGNKHVGMFSLEMMGGKLIDRYFAEHTGIPMYLIKHRKLSVEQLQRLDNCAKEFKDMNIMIDDSCYQSIDSLCNKMRVLKNKGKLDIAFIDHYGFVSDNGFNRNAELTSISAKVKTIAKELEIPIVVLSQLSRELEKREDKRPIKSDLRDSGSLEQDADIILFLYKDSNYHKDCPNPDIVEVIVAKNRDGANNITIENLVKYNIMEWTELSSHATMLKQ
ncbi:MAG: replicative DNA helicase [Erysipelotrichaceae bacterium]